MKGLIYRLRDVLLTVVILLLVGLVAVRLEEGNRQEMQGRARVVDGDTLVLGGLRIRLAGIDAPELAQVCHRSDGDWPCGTQARDFLIQLIGRDGTTCAADGSDRYGRMLAVCAAKSVDLNRAMVANGYAVAFGDYAVQEDEARQNKLGLWAGSFDSPQTWRRTHGGMEEAPHIESAWPVSAFRTLSGRLWDMLSGI